MIISCPSCSAKYHLADSKVKASGTKVRCPRCSYTFSVFKSLEPEKEPPVEPIEESTTTQTRPGIDSLESAFSSATPTEQSLTEKLKNPAERFFDEKTQEYRSLPESIAELQKAKPIDSPLFEEIDQILSSDAAAEEDEHEFNLPQETNVKFIGESEIEASSSEAQNEKSEPEPEAPEEPGEISKTEPKSDVEVSEPKNPSEPSKRMSSPRAREMDPAAISKSSHHSNFETSSKASKSILRPFGQETIFEIQKNYKKVNRKKITVLFLIAGSIFALGFGVQRWLGTQTPSVGSASKEVSKESLTAISRPSGWYQDDPRIYRDILNQSAALPFEEQEAPENRALLAEALILNGLLTGSSAQVVDGLSFSSSLVISYPFSSLGYYGIAAHAIWNSDRLTLRDLVERWPEAYRDEPEFALVEAANDYVNNDKQAALLKISKLLKQYPEFQRANNLGLRFLLETPDSSKNLFSEQKKKEMIEKYRAHRSKIERELREMPSLFRQIDEKLNESTDVARRSEASQQIPGQAPLPPEKTLPGKQNTAVARARKSEPKSKTPAPRANPPVSSAKKSRQSRLPPPSKNLIAQNKLSNQNQSQADIIFSRANGLLKKGDDSGALKLYRDALKLNPEFAEIYKRIGMIYMKRKEPSRAVRSFKLYLQLKPNSQDKKVVEGWISSLQ